MEPDPVPVPVPLTKADVIEQIERARRAVLGAESRLPVHVVVHDGDEAEGPAPAWYEFETGEVHLDLHQIRPPMESLVNRLFPDRDREPPYYDPDYYAVEIRHPLIHPVLDGMLRHEFAHCRYSAWGGSKLDADVRDTVLMFEEVRIERVLINVDRYSLTAMRAMFLWLMEGFRTVDPETQPRALAYVWGLSVGRALAGVVALDETRSIDILARTHLGDRVVDQLSEILAEAVTLREGDIVRKGLRSELSRLAREWNALIPLSEAEEAGFPMAVTFHSPHCEGDIDVEEGSPVGHSKGEGEGEGEGEDESDEMAAALDIVADLVGSDIPGVDRRPSDPAATFRRMSEGYDKNVTRRAPLPDEVAMANRLASSFTSLYLPSLARAPRPSSVPPGRLRGREMVRKSAEAQMGLLPTAQPWENRVRARRNTTPIVIGILTDMSGSMSWAFSMAEGLTWAVGLAGDKIGARSASFVFGDRSAMVKRPGHAAREIRKVSVGGGSEDFDGAAAGADGALGLSVRNGASKVLVVFSDMILVNPGEDALARLHLRRFIAGGTKVVIIGATERSLTWCLGESLVRKVAWAPKSDPDEVVDVLVSALRSASERQG